MKRPVAIHGIYSKCCINCKYHKQITCKKTGTPEGYDKGERYYRCDKWKYQFEMFENESNLVCDSWGTAKGENMSKKRKPSKPKIPLGNDVIFHNCEPYLSRRGVEIVGIPSERQRKRARWINCSSNEIFDGLILYRNEDRIFRHFIKRLRDMCYFVGTGNYLTMTSAIDDLFNKLRPDFKWKEQT